MKARALRVLVVDDDEAVCTALAAVLSSEQHTVAVSMSAEEALSISARLQPDIAIIDVGMPGMAGADLCALLRSRMPNLRIILHTGYDPEALDPWTREAQLVIQKGSILAFLTKFRAFLAH